MKDEECAKMLIESSFKESNLFWVRNSAIAVIQTIVFGFYVSLISEESKNLSDSLNYMICSLGIILTIIHFIILVLSQRYNMAWFGAYKEFVDAKLSENEDSNYKYLNNAIKELSGSTFSIFNTTSIFMFIPISLTIFWIFQIMTI